MIEALHESAIHFRLATPADADILGHLNAQLIQDEGHRNAMSVSELVERMRGWLAGEYEAVIAEECGVVVGYALFRREPDHVYLRQLFVQRDTRRRGMGRRIVQWLIGNVGRDAARVRIEVLVGNEAARSFWKAIGFHEYCVTMELELPKRASDL
jgi:GNAT superfamily N-acetyltransferase